MHFIHGLYQIKDTIAALATPPGTGGIAIIRISGPHAIEIASKVAQSPLETQESHTVRLKSLYSTSGSLIDKALVLVMRAPRSFTGEDVVELHCHGGHLIARKALEALSTYGARPAEPGEFSLRAFLNGKMDLTQAEAIQDMIGAKSEEALKVAESHLEGRLSKKISQFQQVGTKIAAIFEAWVDFPEEDLEFSPFETVIGDLNSMRQEIEHLIGTYREGKIIHDGVSLCLVGAPNVGKSSLMNALLGKERAIVSPIAGTTRDIVEDDAHLNGLSLRLIDTAGIRETEEIIEGEGIRRSKKAIERSDLVLLVQDATRVDDKEMLELVDIVPHDKTILIWNKIDVLLEKDSNLEDESKVLEGLPRFSFPHVVYVSAHDGRGLEALKKAIDTVLWTKGAIPRDEVMITSVRHKHALEKALISLQTVIQGLLAGESPEFVVFDMRQFLKHLGTIIGSDITEDILTAVFSQFCIGK